MPTTFEVREEFAVLKQLDHPHVLRIFEAWRFELDFLQVTGSYADKR